MDRRQFLTIAGAGASLTAGATQAAATTARIAAPRVDQIDSPLGLDNPTPRFSWTIAAPGARDVKQSAYRIRVAKSREALLAGGPLLWDSGKVESDDTFDIA